MLNRMRPTTMKSWMITSAWYYLAPWRHLVKERTGAVAVVFALSLLPLCLAGGAAIDIGRAYLVKSRLGYALDAAGLAAGGATELSDDELEELMMAYFEANYPVEEIGVAAEPEMEISDEEVRLSASATLNTTLMNVVGIDDITVTATTIIIRESKGLEVALVLDNTGSMGTTKMNNLKSAAHSFLDILFGTNAESDLLYISVVPFAGTVNVDTGFGHLNSDYDADDFSPDIWRGCVMARDDGEDQTDTAPTNDDLRWEAYLRPSGSGNWWPPISGSYGQRKGPNKDCPRPVLPLTNVKASVENKIDSMASRGITHINFGLVWGWRTLSNTEPFTTATEYDDDEFEKAIVLMTDGENYIGSSSYGAYGRIADGNLGTTWSSSTAIAQLNLRTTAVCNAVKAQGIIVYTITFQVSSSTVRNLMRDCATDTSNYFDSPDAATLEASFREIGRELSNLRIGG